MSLYSIVRNKCYKVYKKIVKLSVYTDRIKRFLYNMFPCIQKNKNAKKLNEQIAIAKGISSANGGCKVLILRKNQDLVSVKWSEIKYAKKVHANAVKRWSLNCFKDNAIAIIEKGKVVEIKSFSFSNKIKL